MKSDYPGRLALQQRILPFYREAFFDLLASSCAGGLSVFAGDPARAEVVHVGAGLERARLARARNHHFLSPGSPLYLCWQEGLIDWLENWNPDALILEANPRYLSTPQAVRWMRQRRRPVIGWGLGAPGGGGPFGGLQRRRMAAFIRQFDAVIAYSARGADDYRTLGLPESRIYVAPNAVSPRPEAPPGNQPPAAGGPPTVLFVGRLVERKRVDSLIEACSLLPRSLQPRLVIIGDGPARPDLERLAGDLYPQTTFTGSLHGSALRPQYAAADLFVLPGTGGLAVQEAMANGLPVVVARGDGTQGDLVRQENGWNVPEEGPGALAAVLEEALKDQRRLWEMGEESYRIVRDEINLERMVEVFIKVLERVS